jgi:hypothetical protein
MIGNANIDVTPTLTKPLPVECAVIAILPIEHRQVLALIEFEQK